MSVTPLIGSVLIQTTLFAELNQVGEIPDERVHEETVQARALQRMDSDEMEIDQLKESIKTGGYKTVNAIVVIELPSADHVKVVEGNRRLAALTMLKREADAGEAEALSPDLSELLECIPVKKITGGTTEERHDFIEELLGTLHVPGTKAWGPYQQSQRVGRLLERGWPSAQIRGRLGITPQRFTSLRRVFIGMKQMRGDDVYGDYVQPKLFSMFEEALSRPRVREWLGWNEDDGITDGEARQHFYSWITSIDEAGNAVPQKIVDAKDFRLLPRVLDDPVQQNRFLVDAALTLRDASDRVVDIVRQVDWRQLIASDLANLRTVPAVVLAEATEDDEARLMELKDVCETLLRTIEFSRASDARPARDA